ncbi:MAG TPA: hypothetical protein VMQ44_00830 [Candidatus Saccharimonadales bacterium]|nr:hypothetical protein [Candidatus Saccharimonadales bacterium]
MIFKRVVRDKTLVCRMLDSCDEDFAVRHGLKIATHTSEEYRNVTLTKTCSVIEATLKFLQLCHDISGDIFFAGLIPSSDCLGRTLTYEVGPSPSKHLTHSDRPAIYTTSFSLRNPTAKTTHSWLEIPEVFDATTEEAFNRLSTDDQNWLVFGLWLTRTRGTILIND